MNGKTRSILLQVAFKEAAAADNIDDVKARTVLFYELLTSLHDELGIDAEDQPRRGGSGGGFRKPATTRPDAPEFADADGTMWYDYRGLKAENKVNAKHPDFKTTDNQKSLWMYTQNGEPVAEAAPLAAAADAVASLTAPM